MERNTILFYLGGLIALILLTLLTTRQDNLADIAPLPATATSQPTPSPTPTPLSPAACQVTVDFLDHHYLLDTRLVTPTLVSAASGVPLSGTIYAADCVTPLPETLVEVWRIDSDTLHKRLLGRTQTDATGRYVFTLPAPTAQTTLYMRLAYPERQPAFSENLFAGDLHLTTRLVPAPPTERSEGFDLVLPIPE